MNQILSGSPQLEVLSLSLADVHGRLTIHSSSLKALKIEKVNYKRVRSVLTIWAPNVETLEILGDPYGKYVMKNVSCLTNVTVDISFVDAGDDDDDDDDAGDDGGGGGGGGDCYYFSGFSLFEDIIGKAYETNRYVERVTLSDQCIEMLNEMKWIQDRVFEQLSNAKLLTLHHCQVDELKGLLKIFPKLTKLVYENLFQNYRMIYQISWSIKDPSIPKFDTDNSYKSRKKSLKSCLLHLTTVEIAWNPDNDSFFPIVQFFIEKC